jgi:acyl carrier protein
MNTPSPLQDRLLSFLKSEDVDVGEAIGPATPLLKTNLLDSLGLLKLALWIETEIGTRIDLETVDALRDWNTAENIVAFIEVRRSQGGPEA